MLLDLVMPGMDGFQVIENVRTRTWGSHLPIIIISSESTEKAEKNALIWGWLISYTVHLTVYWLRKG